MARAPKCYFHVRGRGEGQGSTVADEFTDPEPVLLLHVRGVVLVAGPGLGKGDLVFLAVTVELTSGLCGARTESPSSLW